MSHKDERNIFNVLEPDDEPAPHSSHRVGNTSSSADGRASASMLIRERDTPGADEVTSAETGPHWSLIRRMAFRFATVYFILYVAPFPAQFITSPWLQKLWPWGFEFISQATSWVNDSWNEIVVWVGANVFDIAITIRPRGQR